TWLDTRATVEATVREAGRLVLCLDRWREHRPVLFIEDVGRSMQRWRGHGQQLARALATQAGHAVHLFMDGSPDRLYRDRTLTRRQPLDELLAELEGASIVVLSDAAELDRRTVQRATWLALLDQVAWLHPRSPEGWDEGARELARHVRVIP